MSQANILDTLKSKPLADLTGYEMDNAKKFALSILRADYWRDVQAVCDDLREKISDGEVSNAGEAEDWIHETVDNHSRIIYTAQNIETLLVSDNDDAFAEDYGTEGMVKDGAINWPALAYCAMKADVMETIGDLDGLFSEDDDTEDDE